MTEYQTKVLLVEDQYQLSDILTFSLQSSFSFEVLETDSMTSGISILKDNRDIRLVICDHSLEGEDSLDLFKYIVDNELDILFISTSFKNVDDYPTYNGRKVNAAVEKENIIVPLNNIIKEMLKKDEKFESMPYTAIAFKTLIHFRGINNDLYIKLLSGRYLKLFQKDDEITQDDIERYKKKGVFELFLRKETVKWIIEQVNLQIKNHIENDKFKFDLRFSIKEKQFESKTILKGSGEETNNIQVVKGGQDNKLNDKEVVKIDKNEEKENSIEVHRISPDLKESTELKGSTDLEQVYEATEKMTKKVKENKDLAKFLDTLNTKRKESEYFQNRINLICNIACFTLKEVGWSSDQSYEKLIYVAYVHDLLLVENLKLAKLQTLMEFEAIKSELSDSEQTLWPNHPEMMDKIRKKKK